MYEMNVQGVAVSARVTFRMAKVRINVLPRYRLTLIATVYPLREISILQASRMCSRDVLFNVDTKNREGGLSFGKPAFLFIRRMRLDYFQASFVPDKLGRSHRFLRSGSLSREAGTSS